MPDALFLPEAEFAAVEKFYPIRKSRRSDSLFLTRVARRSRPARHRRDTRRASINPLRRSRRRCNSASLRSAAGRAARRIERLIDSLGKAGYERVGPSDDARPIRGPRRNSRFVFLAGAIAGARWNFSATKSNRCASSTSIRKPRSRNLSTVEILLGAADDTERDGARLHRRQHHLRIAIEAGRSEEEILDQRRLDLEPGATEDFAAHFSMRRSANSSAGDFMIAEAKRAPIFRRV